MVVIFPCYGGEEEVSIVFKKTHTIIYSSCCSQSWYIIRPESFGGKRDGEK